MGTADGVGSVDPLIVGHGPGWRRHHAFLDRVGLAVAEHQGEAGAVGLGEAGGHLDGSSDHYQCIVC